MQIVYATIIILAMFTALYFVWTPWPKSDFPVRTSKPTIKRWDGNTWVAVPMPLTDEELLEAIRRGIRDYRNSTAEFYAAQAGEVQWQDSLATYVKTRIEWRQNESA